MPWQLPDLEDRVVGEVRNVCQPIYGWSGYLGTGGNHDSVGLDLPVSGLYGPGGGKARRLLDDFDAHSSKRSTESCGAMA